MEIEESYSFSLRNYPNKNYTTTQKSGTMNFEKERDLKAAHENLNINS